MSKEIIVGFDGSTDSSNAALWAASEAQARGTRLRILSCFSVPVAGDAMHGMAAANVYQSSMEAAEQTLARERDAITKIHPGLEITSEALPGHAGQVLVDRAERDDLIVLGASAHQHAAAFWLGSTPRYIVRHSRCPVVIVRGPVESARPRRVVVGVDGSPASAEAVDWAGEEADVHGVNLVLVHAWSYPYAAVDAASSQARDLTQIDAACLLETALESARQRSAAGVVGRLIESSPVAALLHLAQPGDLLVVGSRGRGAVRAGLFGSTVNSVLDESTAPVVVMPRTHATP